MHITLFSTAIFAVSLQAQAQGQLPESYKLAEGKKYQEDNNAPPPVSMFQVWENKLNFTNPTVRQLDSMQTCLVDFPESQFDQCKSGSWHCCWQYQYDNKDAGDNTEILDKRFPDAATHCHGSAWSDKSDPHYKYRKEIFNHVVCEDHGYKRGYWGGIKTGAGVPTLSCGCAEEMPLVKRSDCTQADVRKASQGEFKPVACTGKKANDLRSWYEKIRGDAKGLPNPDPKGVSLPQNASITIRPEYRGTPFIKPVASKLDRNAYQGANTKNSTTSKDYIVEKAKAMPTAAKKNDYTGTKSMPASGAKAMPTAAKKYDGAKAMPTAAKKNDYTGTKSMPVSEAKAMPTAAKKYGGATAMPSSGNNNKGKAMPSSSENTKGDDIKSTGGAAKAPLLDTPTLPNFSGQDAATPVSQESGASRFEITSLFFAALALVFL
ncbi:MAG: hypothetical protein SGCHY_002190 [Lobulomycetales sp.]